MADGSTIIEQHKLQLVTCLAAVAESMRKCAETAETFAAFVNGGAISVDSSAARKIHDLVDASKSNTLIADKAMGGKRKRKADATEEGEGPKRRKRKPKDPNAPKRPASSYILFQNEVRKELKASHPQMSNQELLSLIARQWQEMSEEDKAVYHQAMASAKERYSLDKKAYDSRTPEEVQAAKEATAIADAAKKSRKGAKVPPPVEEKTVPPPVAVVGKRVPVETSPGTESSEGSASDESDEDVRDEHDDEQGSSSSEDEKPVLKRRSNKHTTTTSGQGKKKTSA
ncbi:hypothetical protein M378DRAFT_22958 [Amanita muscaria Koide BX008]|uniref:HMG box domain-containing protein n=1 Tax=Amanita muscaria (strain Koide BX008) TaxID=946122 RepID=A0A0C2SVE3_AMAMK|nr:hypothetical protein M378DRAFT_22958 [Amanita muscaria Koide BX008]